MSLIDYSTQGHGVIKGQRFSDSVVDTFVLAADAKAGDIVAQGVVAQTHIDGVKTVEYKAGDLVPVIVSGRTVVEAGGAVTAGSALDYAANKVVVAAAGTRLVGAKALEAGANGDLIKINL